MRRIKTAFFILVFVIVGGFLHYVLPQHDIVRITSTEVIRTDFNWLNRPFYAQADSGASELATRDLRLINTEKRRTWLLGFFPRDSTRVMVYRNDAISVEESAGLKPTHLVISPGPGAAASSMSQ